MVVANSVCIELFAFPVGVVAPGIFLLISKKPRDEVFHRLSLNNDFPSASPGRQFTRLDLAPKIVSSLDPNCLFDRRLPWHA